VTEYEAVIGLECHVELDTRTKMFCGCLVAFGAEPNTNVCPVCLGHPGSLPVPNREAIRRIILIGLALGSEIAPRSLFHRKNYFYPDMPKNYQISQYDLPACVGGHLDVDLPDGTTSRIGITRVHMEEDTGKTTHAGATGRIHDADAALVDFNRAGVPLVECVSEPDIRSPEEAGAYLRELRATLAALDVSDVRMEEGSLRCDANVSLRPAGGATRYGTKVEIKNMNSVRSLERALAFEIARQTKALEAGEAIVQETRHWDEDAGATASMRSKEEAFDYRYFPEPDIPALEPDAAWIEEIRSGVPELPRDRRDRYVGMGLKLEVARVLVAEPASSALFEETIAAGADQTAAANWITQDLAGTLNKHGVAPADSPATSTHLADLLGMLADDTISGAGAKQALEEVVLTGDAVADVVGRKGLRQVSDADELGAIADEVVAEHPDAVAQFREGKQAVVGFLVGQVMKKSRGSANPKLARELLLERLSG
jgi:aspartyl-tRNA(Asn)/glutamyl-tRNA(Gln) amidotransferase subunit B